MELNLYYKKRNRNHTWKLIKKQYIAFIQIPNEKVLKLFKLLNT